MSGGGRGGGLPGPCHIPAPPEYSKATEKKTNKSTNCAGMAGVIDSD